MTLEQIESNIWNNILDINDDWNIDSFSQELETLEEETILNMLLVLAPNYAKDFQSQSVDKKRENLIIFTYAKEILWDDFCNEFLSKNGKYKNVPFDEMVDFIGETLLADQNKDFLEATEMILTSDELWELHKKLISKTLNNQDILQSFIENQKKENINISEIVDEDAIKTLQEKWYDFKEIKQSETEIFEYLKKTYPNLSLDVSKNIATSIILYSIKMFNKNKRNQEIVDAFKWKWFEIFFENNIDSISWIRKIDALINPISKMHKLLETLKTYPTDGENNKVLVSPSNFIDFCEKIEDTQTSQDLLTKLKAQEKEEKQVLNKEQEKTNLEKIILEMWKILPETKVVESSNKTWKTPNLLAPAAATGALGGFAAWIKWQFEWFQNQWKNMFAAHSADLMSLKESCDVEIIWVNVWETLKKLLDSILKFFWREWGWDEYENEVIWKNFPWVLNYFKENITIDKIETQKDSIFYRSFKKEFESTKTEDKIKDFEIKWTMSYSTCVALNGLGNSQSDLNKQLDSLFYYRNFDQLFKNDSKKKEEFYKKAFTTSEKKQKQEDGTELSLKIWVIDLSIIDEILKENIQQPEDKNDSSDGKNIQATSLTNTVLDNKYKSHSKEISPNWTPLCSRTAVKNLQMFWINNPIQWDAIDCFNQLQSAWQISKVQPNNNLQAKVADIYLKTESPYNHRAASYKWTDGAWYVLDPYYWDNILGKKNRNNPIPYDQYISYMNWKWRPFMWANYFA